MGGDLRAAIATWARVDPIWPVMGATLVRKVPRDPIADVDWTGEYETCLAMATEAHRSGPRPPTSRRQSPRCDVGLALVGLSRHEEGIAWLDRAIELGREGEEGSNRSTARGMDMRAGALRETGELSAARVQSQEALELAKDSGLPPAAISARLDLLYADLVEGDAGAAERMIPDLGMALSSAKGFHQFLWSIRLSVARAETARLAGRHDPAIALARTALAEAGRFGRRKYESSPGPRSRAGSSRPDEPRRPLRSPAWRSSRPSGSGTCRRAGARCRPSPTRRPRSATTRGPRTLTARPSGTSRSSPRGWGTSMRQNCASVPTSRR